MAKTKISEFSATPANNTDIDGINIAEGCAPSGINDAIRELMSQLKDFQAGTAGDSFNGPVGTSTAAAGAFTTLSASSTVSGTGFSTYLASPPAIGGTAAAAVSATTLTTSSTVTHNGGTANGVAYLNGSKVLTTGSALVFDGSNLGLGVTPSAWQSIYRVAQFPGGTAIAGRDDGAIQTILTTNAYRNTSATWTYQGSDKAMRYDLDSDGHKWYTAPSGTAGNAISFTQAMTLDASGNLGVGTTSPSAAIELSRASANVGLFITRTSSGAASYQNFIDGNGDIRFNMVSNKNMMFFTNNTERARIDSSGNLLVGTTSLLAGSPRLNVSSTGSYTATFNQTDNTDRVAIRIQNTYAQSAQNATMIQFIDSGGAERGSVKTTGTATSYNTSSDYRLKENVQPMTGALAKVAALKPVTYKWKADGSAGEGFIAHELAEVVPQCVTGEKDAVDAEGNPVYQGIDTSFLVATLTAAIQEQQAIIEQLKADVAALKGAA